MAPDRKIANAMKRSEVFKKDKKQKRQAKLDRRLEVCVPLACHVPCHSYERFLCSKEKRSVMARKVRN